VERATSNPAPRPRRGAGVAAGAPRLEPAV